MEKVNKKKLGNWCCVPQCKFDKSRSLHRFPKNEKLRKKWAIACKIGKNITSNMCVCSNHFRREDYMPRLNSKHPQLRRNEDIVPSLNLPKRPLDKILTTKQEKQIADRHNRFLKRQIFNNNRAPEKQPDSVNLEQMDTDDKNSNVEANEISIVQSVDEDLNSRDDISALCRDANVDKIHRPEDLHSDLRLSENNSLCYSDSSDEESNCKSEMQNNENSEKINTYSEIVAADVLLELQNKFDGLNNDNFRRKTEEINHQLNNKKKFNLLQLLKTNDDLKIFTGIHFQLLKNLSTAVSLCENKKKFSLLTTEERIVLCLCKLKLNLSFKCLAVLFCITRQSASYHFLVMLHTLTYILEKAIYWPSKEEVHKSMPKCFEKFKDTYIILDCTEIPVEKPKCLKCRLRLYSHYKGCETIKFLVGISPSGLIIFISQAFGGRASDKAIFIQSNILDKLQPTRDAIMVDKGFAIEEECAFKRIKLYIPPKLSKNNQLSVAEVTSTVAIASARVHVERAIQRIKQFQIVKSKITKKTAPYMNEIIKVICGIVNLSNSILADDKFE